MQITKSSLSEFEQSFLKNFIKGYIDSSLMYSYATFLHERQEAKLAAEKAAQAETTATSFSEEIEEPKVTLSEAFEEFRLADKSKPALEKEEPLYILPVTCDDSPEQYEEETPARPDKVSRQVAWEDMAADCYGDSFHDALLASTCYNIPKRNRRLSRPAPANRKPVRHAEPLCVPTKEASARLYFSCDIHRNIAEDVLQELLPALAKVEHYWDYSILEDIFRSEDGAKHDMSRYMENLDLGSFVYKIWQEQLVENNFSSKTSWIPSETREFIINTLPSPRRYVARPRPGIGVFSWAVFVNREQVALDTILETYSIPERNSLFQLHCGFLKAIRQYGLPSTSFNRPFVDSSTIYMFHSPLLGIYTLTKDMVDDNFDWYEFGLTIGKIYFSVYEKERAKDMTFILSCHYVQKSFPPITIFNKHIQTTLYETAPLRQVSLFGQNSADK